jgi:hypothetical protein
MRTPVRTTVIKSQTGEYNLMHIEILSPRYGGIDYLEPIGMITFQQTVGENSWYGRSFEVKTDNIAKLKKFTKLADFVSKNTDYGTQPYKLKELIGADEHVIFESDFVSVSKDGQSLYKVIVNDGHYRNIIAPDEKKAQKILDKLNIANSTLEFVKVVAL